jgi:hypothetical protein
LKGDLLKDTAQYSQLKLAVSQHVNKKASASESDARTKAIMEAGSGGKPQQQTNR